MTDLDIASNISKFVSGDTQGGGIKPLERYSSFDYCFNHFQSFREKDKIQDLIKTENAQLSCLQLGFYLASWGMLRGSSFLLQKCLKVLQPIISIIASADEKLWSIDANTYTEENISLLLDLKKQLTEGFRPHGWASEILVTKIMLGVFGNVPAFDSYFKYGFGVSVFGKKALSRIRTFYQENQTIIEENRKFTLDFNTGGPTHRRYSRAKVIDMIFFIQGGK
ncbi:MAG: hypothetical protein WEC16_01060 [Anaerolineales bacterium]